MQLAPHPHLLQPGALHASRLGILGAQRISGQPGMQATICYLDRANLAYAALELLQDLNFTETIYSIGAGALAQAAAGPGCSQQRSASLPVL